MFNRKQSQGTRARTVGLAVTALVAGGIALAGPAQAGTCGQTFAPVVSGGKAYWQLSCSNNRITMTGWVEDTSADGKCARVKAQFSDATYFSNNACPKGEREYFSWSGPGSLANGYLIVA